MGKRMFDAGEQMWPEEAPFHTPVFVVTHEKRDPWERPGGTTFHFVTDGIEPALDQARDAAGDRDVRIAGGGETILEYVNAGLIDEFTIVLDPCSSAPESACSRAWTRAAWPEPVRCRADAAGDPPDLRSPGAVTVLDLSAPPPRSAVRKILDALRISCRAAPVARPMCRVPPASEIMATEQVHDDGRFWRSAWTGGTSVMPSRPVRGTPPPHLRRYAGGQPDPRPASCSS